MPQVPAAISGSGGRRHPIANAGGIGGSGCTPLSANAAAALSGGMPQIPAPISGSVGRPHPAANVGGIGGSGGTPSSADAVAGLEEDEEAFGHENLRGVLYDKANWSSENSAVFCDICVEEIKTGNTSNGPMTSRGYKNIAEKYYQSTGLIHSRVQLKNRWDQLKGLYGFWLSLLKETALGRTANGTMVASDKFWKDRTKNHSEWKKLRKAPPKCLDQLEIMFEHVAVDGSSSCIPGKINRDEGDKGYEAKDGDGYDASPMSTNSGKRSYATNTCATSLMKKTKSPMVKIMKGIWESIQTTNSIALQVMQGKLRTQSINKAMGLAVESGATLGTREQFMACKLVLQAENCDVFFTIPTNEGRIGWLKQ